MNNIILSGHVGQTPSIKDFESGSKVARFSLAVRNPFKPKAKPTWFQVESWGDTAEHVVSIITQGREVIVQGSLALDEYTSKKNGKTYIAPVVKLVQFTVCGPKPKDEATAEDELESE